MQNETNLRRRSQSLRAGMVARGLFGRPAGHPRQNNPPPNDNLANAQPISGITGTATGNNLLATTGVGEPAPVSGVLSGASIWYVWTAPMAGYMDFDTHNSTTASATPWAWLLPFMPFDSATCRLWAT